LKSLRRKYRKGIKSWESFRTQALRIVQHEALPLQRFEMLLEQYHDGDIRIEELLSEYPMLLNLAELEGVKGLKGWKPVPRDPMDAPRRAMERMSRSELASKVRNRYAEAHPGEEDTSAVDTSRMSKEEMIEIALNGWKSLSKAITMEEREKLREARDVLAKPNSVMLLGGMSKEEARRIVNELERKVGRGMPQRSRLVNQSKGFVPPFKVEELDVDLLAVGEGQDGLDPAGLGIGEGPGDLLAVEAGVLDDVAVADVGVHERERAGRGGDVGGAEVDHRRIGAVGGHPADERLVALRLRLDQVGGAGVGPAHGEELDLRVFGVGGGVGLGRVLLLAHGLFSVGTVAKRLLPE
jgi:hypothetical protein